MGNELLGGIALFVLLHSIRIVAPSFRQNIIDTIGEMAWKGVYSLLALGGLYLMVVGYADARMNPTWIWHPPVWTRHSASLLTLLAFIFMAAAYVPGNKLKAAVGHPMYLAVKLWAAAHLLANGGLHDIGMFGALLVWSIVGFAVSRRRDRAAGVTRESLGASRTIATVVLGLAAWVAFAMWLHVALIGVAPFAVS
jgi:uncharacterized membrane protein